MRDGRSRTPLLHVLSSTDRRGAEVFGVRLDAALAELGWATTSVALASGRQEDALPVPVLGPATLGPTTLYRLRRASTGRLVVAHGSTTLPACALATAGKASFLYRNIGDPSYWAGTPRRRLRVRIMLRRARAVVALTEAAADVLRSTFRVRSDRIFVIPNAVPLDRFPPVDEHRRAQARATLGLPDGDVVAYIGALSTEKNVADAIDAVSRLAGAQLVIQGDGPQRGLLERQAAGRLAGRIRFVPAAADPSTVLAAADVLVLPSLTEGMPAVLIEAAFTGIPVVASHVGGVAEIVLDGETGVLVPPRDPEALASALRAVLREPGSMGKAGRAHCAARFDMDKVVPAWDQVLRTVTAVGRG